MTTVVLHLSSQVREHSPGDVIVMSSGASSCRLTARLTSGEREARHLSHNRPNCIVKYVGSSGFGAHRRDNRGGHLGLSCFLMIRLDHSSDKYHIMEVQY